MNKEITIFGSVCNTLAEFTAKILSKYEDVSLLILCDSKLDLAKSSLEKYLSYRQVREDCRIKWVQVDVNANDLGISSDHEIYRHLKNSDFIFSPNFNSLSSNPLVYDYFYKKSLALCLDLFLRSSDGHFHFLSSDLSKGRWHGAWTEYDVQDESVARNSLESGFIKAERLIETSIPSSADVGSCGRYTIYRLPLFVCGSEGGALLDRRGWVDEVINGIDDYDCEISYNASDSLYSATTAHVADVLVANTFAKIHTAGILNVRGVSVGIRELFAALVGEKHRGSIKSKSQLSFSIKKALNSYVGDSYSVKRGNEASEYFYPKSHSDGYRYDLFLEKNNVKALVDSPSREMSYVLDSEESGALLASRMDVAKEATLGCFQLPKEYAASEVLDGVVKEYWSFGAGSPLLLISGLLGPESFFGLAKILSKKYRVIITDLNGMGRSNHKSEGALSVQGQASAIKSLVSKLIPNERFTFISSDVAAPVIQYYASRWSNNIDLVLHINPLLSSVERVDYIDFLSGLSDEDISAYVEDKNTKINFIKNIILSPFVVGNRHRIDYSRVSLLAENICKNKGSIKSFRRALGNVVAEADNIDKFIIPTALFWSSNSCGESFSKSVALVESSAETKPPHFFSDSSLDVYESKPYLVAENLLNILDVEGLNKGRDFLDFTEITNDARGVGIDDLSDASKGKVNSDEKELPKSIADKDRSLELVQ
ncbi:MAG: hypothetical protein COA42_14325 [Alteromonadaceae bacterium]|nr:MAG: hypothetical protein COA42_14325 [Alteromonadaceae bacterium]